jgi:glycosyltransferase involved in cell wall biosynthesis
MSRIVMYVYNDMRSDSRVIREAATLVQAGHRVTVMARPADPASPLGDRETRAGFEIVRIPLPGGWRLWWTLARYPWRTRGELLGRLRAGASRLPTAAGASRLPTAAGAILGALVLLAFAAAWSIVCYPLHLLLGRLQRGRPRTIGPLDWLVRWRYAIGGWAAAAAAAAPPADIQWGHDLNGLAAAALAHRGDERSRLVYDSHEIYLEARSSAEQPAWARRLVAASERRWVAQSNAVVTVNEALAAELERRYRPSEIAVVHNCPARWTPGPDSGRTLGTALGLGAGATIAIHHGAFARHRGIEELAAAMLEPGLEELHVVLLGSGPERRAFERLAREPVRAGRLHVLAAVDPDDLLDWLSGADVGVMPIQATTLNHRLATPNKLFECLAAGVPVVVSDFPGMRQIVLDEPSGPLGATCDPASPGSIAAAIRSIIELPAADQAALRQRCLKAAHERWNWEAESVPLLDIAARLGPGSGS